MESKKAVYETNIDVNAAIKKAKDELVDYHNKFMSIMNDYEIDVYFSELAAEYNLTPVDLTINEASETEIKSFSVALQEAKAESNSKSETTSNSRLSRCCFNVVFFAIAGEIIKYQPTTTTISNTKI